MVSFCASRFWVFTRVVSPHFQRYCLSVFALHCQHGLSPPPWHIPTHPCTQHAHPCLRTLPTLLTLSHGNHLIMTPHTHTHKHTHTHTHTHTHCRSRRQRVPTGGVWWGSASGGREHHCDNDCRQRSVIRAVAHSPSRRPWRDCLPYWRELCSDRSKSVGRRCK
jgi:hypothetical protein